MKKILVLALLLAPAIALGASDYTKTVKQGGTVRVCVPTGSEIALVSADGAAATVAPGTRKPGGCAKLKVPKTAAPGTYSLQTYRPTYTGCGVWSTNCQTAKNDLVEIGTVTVKAKKAKR